MQPRSAVAAWRHLSKTAGREGGGRHTSRGLSQLCLSFASSEIRVGELQDIKRAKGKNVYSMYGETSFHVFRDKLIPQIVFSSLDR